jgi:uncharacterized repeat protein (TIGR03806 family)
LCTIVIVATGCGGAAEPVDPGPQTCLAPPAGQPSAKLSQTGCVSATEPTKLAATVIPYDVNSPLWSDGADKVRGMALPDGATIHVNHCATEPAACPKGDADDGRWVLPVGTVMVKSFLFDGKLVETRLLVHTDAAHWNGYSYQWDEAQTDATLNIDDRVEVQFDTGKRVVDWHYPSRMDCNTCHTETAGGSLGPTTPQMNRTLGGKNQIDTLAARGLFDAPVPAPYMPALATPYPSQSGSPPAGATVENRARSYLQANCAFCHRPDDFVFANMDFRYGTPLADMKACNVVPAKGEVGGVQNVYNITPGDPGHSVLWLRMNTVDDFARMPRIARYVIDQQAVDLIGQWITGIAPSACPPPDPYASH